MIKKSRDGDSLTFIKAEFARITNQSLEAAVVSLPRLKEPLARYEVSSIEAQLKNSIPVLFTGDAGTGKSGVGAMLAEAARAKGYDVLLLDARKVNYVKSDNDFRRHFNLKGPVEDAVARLTRKRRCRVIIDQFDNVIRTLVSDHLINLVRACQKLDGAEVIVISRNSEAHEESSLKELVDRGFIELKSDPLTPTKADGVLRELGVSDAPPELVDLCCNLLNLSLVATLKREQPTYEFSATLDEVDLWEGFLGALTREEGRGQEPSFGEEVVVESVRLAGNALLSEDRTVLLDDPRPPTHIRLISWGILVPEEGDIHRFRHERLQDFLVARSAKNRNERPRCILSRFNRHRTRGIFVWMDKLYARRPDSRHRAEFLQELFAPDSNVPFYALADVLNHYMHLREPTADGVALPIIIEALKIQEGLRTYFFRSQPDPAWARILWNAGFFDNPPAPQPFEDQHLLPFWDEQNYLLSVAPSVPDLLVGQLERLRGDCGYVDRVIRALRFIPGEKAERAVPRILQWVDDYRIGQTLTGAVEELITHLAAEHRLDAAFDLFDHVTAPHPPSHVKEVSGYVINGEAISLFGGGESARKGLSKLALRLAREEPERVFTILEQHLLKATVIEARTRKMSNDHIWAFWTSMFSDERGYGDRDYKNDLLRTLRKVLEYWVERDAVAVESVIERYLGEDQKILRRLGLYLLQKYPAYYSRLVRKKLCDPENMDTLAPDEEFLMLLSNGYQFLKRREKKDLVDRIARGLPPALKQHLRDGDDGDRAAEFAEYAANVEKKWVRDHLAMLKNYLPQKRTRLLARLIKDVGESAEPGTGRVPNVYTVNEVSPLTAESMALMDARSVVKFAREWRPDPDEHGRERRSYDGLARELAEEMLLNRGKYGEVIDDAVLIRPEFASAVIDRLTNTERYTLTWDEKVSLCERLLADETVRHDIRKVYNGGWTGVRLSVVRLIATWVNKTLRPAQKEYLPPQYFERVRDMLMMLCDDPDPEPLDEDVEKGDTSEGRAGLIAISHVRPSALSTLIRYALYKAEFDEQLIEGGKPPNPTLARLELCVREVLTRKLDRSLDRSLAMHSVYGEHLSILRWLDAEWVDTNIERIFLEADDEQLRWCGVAAWDSFVQHTRSIYLPFFEQLRSHYARAIENMRTGWVTRTSPKPARDLAGHLLIEYLNADYDFQSRAGQQSLIATFFKHLTPGARGDAAWVLWSICNNSRNKLETYWKRALALWQWRVVEAFTNGHPTDYDEEINWFTLLLNLAKGRETLSSLSPLLEKMLPHIARPERRSTGWDHIEEYLAQEVENDPLNAAKLYRLMHFHRKDAAKMFFPHKEAFKIVWTALGSPQAKGEVAEMIDFLARHGNYVFRPYLS